MDIGQTDAADQNRHQCQFNSAATEDKIPTHPFLLIRFLIVTTAAIQINFCAVLSESFFGFSTAGLVACQEVMSPPNSNKMGRTHLECQKKQVREKLSIYVPYSS